MSVDYDLVVIGGSAAGIQAAIAATRLKARVVLVAQDYLADRTIDTQVLTAVGQTLNQLQRAAQLGMGTTDAAFPSASTWEQAKRWSIAAVANAEGHSPAVLASLGIEVIAGCGEFHRKPKLGFLVNGRSLRSRAYLLAIHHLPVRLLARSQLDQAMALRSLPEIDGLATIAYLTADSALQKIPVLEPLHRFVIIGREAIGVELAQSLVRLGRSVTLIVPDPQLLPHEDAEAAFLIQAQLESEGVEILTETTVTQVRDIDGKKWVQAGNRAIEADEIILAAPPPFDSTRLNLKAANVEQSPSGILVNAKLQTTNPRIYACRGRIDGYNTPHIAIADAQIALKNALSPIAFLPIASVSDRPVPSLVSTNPTLARIGHTETSAMQHFGNNVVILKRHFKTLIKAQIQGETTGFCKLIVHRNGKLLGAHIVGSQAEELIGTIALAMQQDLKIGAIAHLVLPSSSLATILQQTAADWHRQRLKQNTKWQDFLERFFNWRRSIAKD